jgi:hypothetical protein
MHTHTHTHTHTRTHTPTRTHTRTQTCTHIHIHTHIHTHAHTPVEYAAPKQGLELAGAGADTRGQRPTEKPYKSAVVTATSIAMILRIFL